MSSLTRTEQKFGSRGRSSRWKRRPGLERFNCRSNAVVLTAFCSAPVSRTRLAVKVSAIRNSIAEAQLVRAGLDLFFRLTLPVLAFYVLCPGFKVADVTSLNV